MASPFPCFLWQDILATFGFWAVGWAKQNIETTLKFRLSDWVFVFWPFLTIKKSVNNESYTWLQPWYDLSIDLSDMYQVVVNRLMLAIFHNETVHSEAVHTKTLFCENAHVLHHFGQPSTRILKTQCLKTHFFENGSQGGKTWKHRPPVLVWTVNPHTFQNDDAIAPPLDLLALTSEQQ